MAVDPLRDEIRQAAEHWVGMTFREAIIEEFDDLPLPQRAVFAAFYRVETSFYAATHEGWGGKSAYAGTRVLDQEITKEKADVLAAKLADYIRTRLSAPRLHT